ILDKEDKVVRRYSSHPPAEGQQKPDEVKVAKGMNRFVWDLNYTRPEDFPGMVLWGGFASPRAVPGSFRARFRVGESEEVVPVRVQADPRSSASLTDMQAQFEFVTEVGAKLTEVHRTLKKVRETRDQIQALIKRLDEKKRPDSVKMARQIIAALTAAEE